MTDICSALEALLFAAGDPIPVARLSLVLEISEDEVLSAWNELSEALKKENHGITVLKIGDKLQMCSAPAHSSAVAKVLEQRKPSVLSQSSVEALSIVAYFQPVTLAYINKIRGVDSSYTVSSLADRGLIEISGRLEAPGRPSLYRTTDLFLRTMGISDLSELPPLPDLTNTEGISSLQSQIEALQNSEQPIYEIKTDGSDI